MWRRRTVTAQKQGLGQQTWCSSSSRTPAPVLRCQERKQAYGRRSRTCSPKSEVGAHLASRVNSLCNCLPSFICVSTVIINIQQVCTFSSDNVHVSLQCSIQLVCMGKAVPVCSQLGFRSYLCRRSHKAPSTFCSPIRTWDTEWVQHHSRRTR